MVSDVAFGSALKTDLFTLISAHFFIDSLENVHVAFIPLFMVSFDLSLFEVGLVVMVPRLCAVFITIPSGMLADRIGYFRQIIVSLTTVSVASILAATSPNVFFLVLALSLFEIARMLYHPSSFSAVSQISSSRRGTSLGLHMVGGSSGFAFGPISAGLLLRIVDWRIVYLLWVIPPLLCIHPILKLRIKHGSKKRHKERGGTSIREVTQSIRSSLSISFLILLIVVSLDTLGVRVVSTFMSPYLVLSRRISVSNASILVGLIAMAGIFGAPSGGFFADRFGGKRWLSVSFMGVLMSLLGLVFIHPMFGLVTFLLLFGYFRTSISATHSSLVADLTRYDTRGIAYALYFLPIYLFGALAAIVGGYIAESFGVIQIFTFAIGFVFISLVILQLIRESN